MTDQDKTLEVAEERDGSAVVQLPEGEKSPQGTREDFSEDADDSDDRDEGSEDSSEGVSDSDPDREAIRAARREERQLKKQLQRARQTESTQLINSLKRQNEQMAERLAVLEKRTAGSDMARLDKAIEDGHLKLGIGVVSKTLLVPSANPNWRFHWS